MPARTVRRRTVRRWFDPEWTPSREAAEREIRRTLRRRYRSHRRRVFLVMLAVAALIGLLLSQFVFQLVTVRGTGMSPTLESGAIVVCIRQSALDRLAGIVPETFRRVGRNSLALISYAPPEEEQDEDAPAPLGRSVRIRALLVKRVIGLAGDVIDVSADGALTASGSTASDATASGATANGGAASGISGASDIAANDIAASDIAANDIAVSDRVYPITVPGGQLFVMGDNRGVSVDSRMRAFGMVPESDVIGRPVAVVWPAYAIGLVN